MKLESITVFLVDDEAVAQTILKNVLQTLGVCEDRIVTAVTGKEARDLLENFGGTIDLVISDIEMPEMDGFELARKIRYGIVKRYQKVPLLMLTGQDTEDNIRKGRIHKIDGIIIKPPRAEDLLLCINKAVIDRT